MSKKYLKELVKKVKIDGKVSETIANCVKQTASIVFETFGKDFEKSGKLRPLIEKLTEKNTLGDVEKTLKKARLAEIKKEKVMLEAKLNQVTTSLHMAEAAEENRIRPNLQIEKFRREYFEEEKKKAEEIAKKTKEYYQEQKKRQHKAEKNLQKIAEKAEEEKRLESKKIEQEKKKIKEDYKKELRKMMRNSKQRKKDLLDVVNNRQELIEVINEKPLYQKMEEKYINDFEIKELEKRKAELAKKRLNFQPLNKQELLAHIRKHDALMREKEKSSNVSFIDETLPNHSKFIEEVMRQDRVQKQKAEEIKKSKHRQLENRISYAENVREMFTPTIDRFKQLELALRLEKLKNPAIRKKINYEASTAQSDSELKKKKIVKRLENEKGKERGKSKPIDYLAERRKQRKEQGFIGEFSDEDWEEIEKNEEVGEEDLKRFKKKADLLEKKAKKAELSLTLGSPEQIQNIEYVEKVNSMLVSSIKAKLAVLKHV